MKDTTLNKYVKNMLDVLNTTVSTTVSSDIQFSSNKGQFEYKINAVTQEEM